MATTTLRRRLGAAAAITTALSAVLATAGTAQAGNYAYGSCPSGYVCAYSGTGASGSIKGKTDNDKWSTAYGVRSLLNNGQKWEGADHIRYRGVVNYGNDTYRTVSGCLHWNEGGKDQKTSGSYVGFPASTTITKAVWGDECRSNEPIRVLGPEFH